MRANLPIATLSSVSNGEIEHNGNSIQFSTSIFTKRSFKDIDIDNFDVFEQINAYWADQKPEVQTKIFNIYEDILTSYDNILLDVELEEYITDKIAELYEYIQYDDLYSWVAFKGTMRVPTNVLDDYVANIDNNTSQDKTYIKKDYLELMVAALFFRAMIPIWGEYIARTRKQKGTQFKEYYAFKLLKKTGVFELPCMTKLKRYIDAIVADKTRPDSVLRNISSDEFNYWLLALVCVRKLTVADIRGDNTEYNNISYIYKYVRNKSEATDNNFENLYKEKIFNNGSGGDENKLSGLDMYKIKATISPGEIVELEFSLQNKDYILGQLSPTMDRSLLPVSMKTSSVLMSEKLVEPQLLLLGWVFKPVISPRGLSYIPKETIVESLGMLEAILWSRGHKYLALLVTSYPEISDSDMIISPVDSKIRVDAELHEELIKYYPFTRAIYSRKRRSRTMSVADVTKTVNLASESINNLTDMFSMYSWRLTASEDKIVEVFGTKTRRCPILPDIKNYLTKLVVEIGSRKYT